MLDPDRATAAVTVAGAGISLAVRVRDRRPDAGREGSSSLAPADEDGPYASSGGGHHAQTLGACSAGIPPKRNSHTPPVERRLQAELTQDDFVLAGPEA